MIDDVMENMVQQRLRQKQGQVYCADCLAKDLQQNPAEVRAAMDTLVSRNMSVADACPCGGTGLMDRW
jgi:hypothetical protein